MKTEIGKELSHVYPTEWNGRHEFGVCVVICQKLNSPEIACPENGRAASECNSILPDMVKWMANEPEKISIDCGKKERYSLQTMGPRLLRLHHIVFVHRQDADAHSSAQSNLYFHSNSQIRMTHFTFVLPRSAPYAGHGAQTNETQISKYTNKIQTQTELRKSLLSQTVCTHWRPNKTVICCGWWYAAPLPAQCNN